MIISGNKIARAIETDLKGRVNGLHTVHIFIVGDNPVIESFVARKRQFADALEVDFVECRYDADVTEELLIKDIQAIGTSQRDGIVVQLPLPPHMDTKRVLNSVPLALDIDGLAEESAFLPPVAGAVSEILEHKNIEVQGKEVLVIGKGALVGVPVAHLFSRLGGYVSIADKDTTKEELTALCLKSDIIVSGAGVPRLVTPEMVNEGVVLIDAGTSTQAGSVVGDIAHECAQKAKYFSRTPGGVGPITVAVLFKNLLLK
jgi:methylenetetrahydrofolate dehydrogenase (NADP+)/methenyltetrahydrofolate cyclohydrolase